MELRTLKYFLAVCQEGNMSRAAERLHVTQPTLSRQISDLERELGVALFIRRSRSVEPTDAGLLLRQRASDIVELADRTVDDFKGRFDSSVGDVSIVVSDPQGIQAMAEVIREYRRMYPNVRFHLRNAGNDQALARIDQGSDDFAILIGFPDSDGYGHIPAGITERWGVFMRAGDPLARKRRITRADLADKPLIVPERTFSYDYDVFTKWFGAEPSAFDIRDTYMHGRSGTVLLNEQTGYMLGGDGMSPSGEGTGLEFRLLDPPVSLQVDFVWREGRAFSGAAHAFLDLMRERTQLSAEQA